MQIPLEGADLSKGDNKTLPLVAVEIKMRAKDPPSCKLANRIFQMENYCKGSGIAILKSVSINIFNLDGFIGHSRY